MHCIKATFPFYLLLFIVPVLALTFTAAGETKEAQKRKPETIY